MFSKPNEPPSETSLPNILYICCMVYGSMVKTPTICSFKCSHIVLSLTIVSLDVQLEACTFHEAHITEEQNSRQNPHNVREWYAQHWQGVLKILR